MILEVIVAGVLLGAVPVLVGWNAPSLLPFEAHKPPVLEQASTVPNSDLTAMIVALLKEDKDWTGDDNLTHATGIVIASRYVHAANYTTIEVFVHDESGVKSKAELSGHDLRLIRGEVNGFKHRREAAKQRALTTEVAKRIVALRNGTLSPLLGDDGVSDAEDDNLGGSDPVSPNYIGFDPRTGRLVKVGAGTRVDPTFIKRYSLGHTYEDI